jgi:hypothetical protein
MKKSLIALAAVLVLATLAFAGDAYRYEKITPTVSTGFSTGAIASKPDYALITVEAGTIRFTVHGVAATNTGAAVGILLGIGDKVIIDGNGDVQRFRCIQGTPGNGGTLRATFFKN